MDEELFFGKAPSMMDEELLFGEAPKRPPSTTTKTTPKTKKTAQTTSTDEELKDFLYKLSMRQTPLLSPQLFSFIVLKDIDGPIKEYIKNNGVVGDQVEFFHKTLTDFLRAKSLSENIKKDLDDIVEYIKLVNPIIDTLFASIIKKHQYPKETAELLFLYLFQTYDGDWIPLMDYMPNTTWANLASLVKAKKIGTNGIFIIRDKFETEKAGFLEGDMSSKLDLLRSNRSLATSIAKDFFFDMWKWLKIISTWEGTQVKNLLQILITPATKSKWLQVASSIENIKNFADRLPHTRVMRLIKEELREEKEETEITTDISSLNLDGAFLVGFERM